ncbi:hypothetical protein ACOSQ3_004011 [Xanthoceras sorbifolium]
MTAFKAVLMSSFANSRASIPRNGVSSLSKLFSTSHPKSIISKESLMAQEDRAQLREFLYGKCKSVSSSSYRRGLLVQWLFFEFDEANLVPGSSTGFIALVRWSCLLMVGSK